MILAKKVGMVVRACGSYFDVDIGDGEVLQAAVRVKLRKSSSSSSPVVVGDWVELEWDEVVGRGVIERVLPRRSEFRRAAPRQKTRDQVLVANLSQVVVVTCKELPVVPFSFVDRILVASQVQGIRPLICVNKIDLSVDFEEVCREYRLYELLGYGVLYVSAWTGEGLGELRRRLCEEISVFVGRSGVGKSSLLNALLPGLDLPTGEVSLSTRKGQHVTTHVRLVRLEGGGYVVDTPGVKEFGILDLDPVELADYFPEMVKFRGECRFHNCLHLHEPGCGVKGALERGEIDMRRYRSYCGILESLEERRRG